MLNTLTNNVCASQLSRWVNVAFTPRVSFLFAGEEDSRVQAHIEGDEFSAHILTDETEYNIEVRSGLKIVYSYRIQTKHHFDFKRHFTPAAIFLFSLIWFFCMISFPSPPSLLSFDFFFLFSNTTLFLCPSSPCGGLQALQLIADCWFIAQKTSEIWAASPHQKCVVTSMQRPRTCCHRLPGRIGMGRSKWSRKRVSISCVFGHMCLC